MNTKIVKNKDDGLWLWFTTAVGGALGVHSRNIKEQNAFSIMLMMVAFMLFLPAIRSLLHENGEKAYNRRKRIR